MSQLISVQQRSEQPDEAGNWQAVVRVNNGPENHITISNPSAGEEEQELAWYFEEHLEFPFTGKVRASNAATSITTY